MSGIVIHIPTGELIAEQEDLEEIETQVQRERSILDIAAPDGRSILSIQKITEDTESSSPH